MVCISSGTRELQTMFRTFSAAGTSTADKHEEDTQDQDEKPRLSMEGNKAPKREIGLFHPLRITTGTGLDDEVHRQRLKAALTYSIQNEEEFSNEYMQTLEAILQKLLEEFSNKDPEKAKEKVVPIDYIAKVYPNLPAVVRRAFDTVVSTPYEFSDYYLSIDAISIRCKWYQRKISQRSLLALYCDNTEFITYVQLEDYLRTEVVPMMELKGTDFPSLYLVVATVGTFYPLLTRNRQDSISFLDLILSSLLDDMDEAIIMSQERELDELAVYRNWYSKENFLDILDDYRKLMDDTGTIPMERMFNVYSGVYNRKLIEGVYRAHKTFPTLGKDGIKRPHLDFEGFARFIRMLRPLSQTPIRKKGYISTLEPVSIRYVFSCLDVYGVGYLDLFTIKEIMEYQLDAIRIASIMKDNAAFAFDTDYPVENACDVFFDMVNPKDPSIVTLNDLLNSPLGPSALAMLVDGRMYIELDETRE